MQITLESKPFAGIETEALVSYVFEETDPVQGRVSEIDQLTGGLLRKLARSGELTDRKSTRLNSSHSQISYAVFCLKKKIYRHTNSHMSPPLTSTAFSSTSPFTTSNICISTALSCAGSCEAMDTQRLHSIDRHGVLY